MYIGGIVREKNLSGYSDLRKLDNKHADSKAAIRH